MFKCLVKNVELNLKVEIFVIKLYELLGGLNMGLIERYNEYAKTKSKYRLILMIEESRLPNIHNIDKLLDYLPYFKDTKNHYSELINKPPQIPFYSYSDMVMKFYKSLY